MEDITKKQRKDLIDFFSKQYGKTIAATIVDSHKNKSELFKSVFETLER